MAHHPHRLERSEYQGLRAYFITACAYGRLKVFEDAATAQLVIDQLFRTATKHGFVITAYCVMKDHVHVLLTAKREDCDLLKWINLWGQLTGYEFKQRTGQHLWQEGYWDHTLRSDESIVLTAAYIVANPVRAGFVTHAQEYPYSGSETYSMKDLSEFVDRSDG